MHTKLFLCLVFVLGIVLVGSGCAAPIVYEVRKEEKKKKEEKQEQEELKSEEQAR
jgi:predicted membrane protein